MKGMVMAATPAMAIGIFSSSVILSVFLKKQKVKEEQDKSQQQMMKEMIRTISTLA